MVRGFSPLPAGQASPLFYARYRWGEDLSQADIVGNPSRAKSGQTKVSMRFSGESPDGNKKEASTRMIRIVGPYWFMKLTKPSSERGKNG